VRAAVTVVTAVTVGYRFASAISRALLLLVRAGLLTVLLAGLLALRPLLEHESALATALLSLLSLL
jgi:hypothetical protein